MYALKRQFRIWGHEISTLWEGVPFMGRILLGAGVSLGLALLMVKQVIQPLNEQIASLRSGLAVPDNLNPEQDEEILMHRDRTAKLQDSLTCWDERLRTLQKNADVLQPEVHLKVIRELQTLLDRCGIMLVSEKLEPQPTASANRPLRRFTHLYEVRGRFRQLEAMLLLLDPLPWRIELRDLALTPCEQMPSMLQLTFALDIFYLGE